MPDMKALWCPVLVIRLSFKFIELGCCFVMGWLMLKDILQVEVKSPKSPNVDKNTPTVYCVLAKGVSNVHLWQNNNRS